MCAILDVDAPTTWFVDSNFSDSNYAISHNFSVYNPYFRYFKDGGSGLRLTTDDPIIIYPFLLKEHEGIWSKVVR